MPFQLMPSEQLCYSTVRISCELEGGGGSVGTGYIYGFLRNERDHVPAIVTNKHVVKGSLTGTFNLTLAGSAGEPLIGQHLPVTLDQFEQRWIMHPDPEVDLCAMPIAPLLAQAKSKGRSFFFVQLDDTVLPSEDDLDSLGALEEIVMIGYPTGLWDSVNNMPILRRGITATHPNLDYEGRKEFLIDAACFPGSSGSPVLLFNQSGWIDRQGSVNLGAHRVKLLGTLYAGPQHTTEGDIKIVTIPTQQKAITTSTIPINLGMVIKSSELRVLEEAVRQLTNK